MLTRVFAVCIGLFVLVVCVTSEEVASPYNPPASINVRSGFTLEKGVLTDREIPTLLLSSDRVSVGKRPIVIALHGGAIPEVLDEPGMTAKEAWFVPEEFHDAPYTLAEAGILVVIIDAWWAGERYRPEHARMVEANYLEALVRGWVETTRDVSLVIDALAKRDDVDVERVGVCGRSGGGIVSLMAAARDTRVTAVTSWAGCSDIEGLARSKAPDAVVDGFIADAPGVKDLLKEFDLTYHASSAPPTAILMMNNRKDPAMPIALAEATHEKLLAAYADMPERLRFRVLDTKRATHTMSRENFDEGCEWLIRHLAGKD